MPEDGRDEVHDQWEGLLRAGPGGERGREWGDLGNVDQGFQHKLAGDEPELGDELAEQLLPQRPEPVLQGADR